MDSMGDACRVDEMDLLVEIHDESWGRRYGIGRSQESRDGESHCCVCLNTEAGLRGYGDQALASRLSKSSRALKKLEIL